MIDRKNIYRCSCGTSGLVFEADPEMGGVCVTVWRFGTSEKGWRERLRHCIYILRHGTPYVDETILNPETALLLADDIMRAVHEKWERNP